MAAADDDEEEEEDEFDVLLEETGHILADWINAANPNRRLVDIHPDSASSNSKTGGDVPAVTQESIH